MNPKRICALNGTAILSAVTLVGLHEYINKGFVHVTEFHRVARFVQSFDAAL